MEDIIMLSTEWDWNLALQVRKEEGFEEGLEKGIQKGIEKGIGLGVKKRDAEILALMNQAKNLEDFMYLKEQLQTSIENAP
jgi:flagellar biosynthesis/type III secretory pathway protein FliH